MATLDWMSSIRQVIKLAVPNLISFLALYTVWMGTIFYVSSLNDKVLLGSVGMGAVIGNVFGFSIGTGLSSVLDTLVSQAAGAGHSYLSLVYLNRSRIISTVIVLPSSFILYKTESILLWLKQDEHIAKYAGEYILGMLPGLWAFFMFSSACSYLRSWKKPLPILYINLITSGFHLCWLFYLVPIYGAYGTGMCMGITHWTRFIFVEFYINFYPKIKKRILSRSNGVLLDYRSLEIPCTLKWTRESLSHLQDFLYMSISSASLMWSEWWAYEIQGIFAGWVGTNALAAHVACSNFITVIYMGPIGISQAASALVGGAIGEGYANTAKRLSICICAFTGILYGFIIFVLLFPNTEYIAHLYSQDTSVLPILYTTLRIVCFFAFFDAQQGVIEGVLRGCALQKTASIYKICTMVGVRLPGGYCLALILNYGLPGIWSAATVGMCLTVICYCKVWYSCDYDACVLESQERHDIDVVVEDETTEIERGYLPKHRVPFNKRKITADLDIMVTPLLAEQ